LLGLVFTSLAAAFMSTLSTHLNWGASYLVHDVYQRFVKPEASEKELVWYGRLATLGLIVLAALLALQFQNAMQAFNILLQIGAGTGLIYILRWFWWRINPYSEITAMIISLLVAIYFEWMHHQVFGFEPMADHLRLVSGIGITTACWLIVTFLTKPDDMDTLKRFYRLIGPWDMGWKKVINSTEESDKYSSPSSSSLDSGFSGEQAQAIDESGALPLKKGSLGRQVACMILGCFGVYSFLFGTGYLIYGNHFGFVTSLIIFLICSVLLFRTSRQLSFRNSG